MSLDYEALSNTLRATAATFLTVFSTLEPAKIAHIQSEGYLHSFAPASVNIPVPLNRETLAAHIIRFRDVLSGFPVQAKQVWPNPILRQVVVWADGEAVFHDHVKDNNDENEWTYRGEYVFVLTMDSSAEKIEQVLEFVDSKETDRLRGLVSRARTKLDEDAEMK